MKPKLTLIIDIRADTDNARWCIKSGMFVDWFLPVNVQYITSKKFSSAEKNKIIGEYTKHIYAIRRQEVARGVKETRRQWKRVERAFYACVDKIFQGHDWPQGNYIGYASIYLMFPRNINKKTFFFPYAKDGCDPIRTIAHEMLHFMFFDYIQKRYGLKEHDTVKGKNPKYIWQVSETFNTVIENRMPYKKIFGMKGNSKPYPGCEKMFIAMTKQWARNQDIESFLDAWLKYALLARAG